MQSTSTGCRLGSIALGIMCGIGTACVLFSDLKTLTDVTTDHLMTAIVLVGTIAAGHLLGDQVRAWRIGSAVGLAVLFTAGTVYCVISSAARNVELTASKVAIVSHGNDQRARLEAEARDAKAEFARARDAAAIECASGAKGKCTGRKDTRDDADKRLQGLQARLASLNPAQVENAGIKHAAKVLSGFINLSAETLTERILDLWPFLKAAFLEVGTIVFFGIGLTRNARFHPVSRPVPLLVPANDQVEPDPEPGHSADVVNWVREFHRRHGRNPQIPEVQAQFQLAKTTAWRRIKAAG